MVAGPALTTQGRTTGACRHTSGGRRSPGIGNPAASALPSGRGRRRTQWRQAEGPGCRQSRRAHPTCCNIGIIANAEVSRGVLPRTKGTTSTTSRWLVISWPLLYLHLNASPGLATCCFFQRNPPCRRWEAKVPVGQARPTAMLRRLAACFQPPKVRDCSTQTSKREAASRCQTAAACLQP